MMDSYNISLKNFQSITDADLEFIPGLNLIVGQSNSGKTAVLRAVNSVINNPSRGKYYIKRGNDCTEVTIKFDGNNIIWRRTLSDVTYEVNGELFKKVGRNTLFDLKEDFGFVRDDNDNIMNIEGEWDLPFPFDRTPSELFKLFENVFCISDSSVILKSFKDEESNIVKEKLALEDKADRINKKISGLEDLKSSIDLDEYTNKLNTFKEHVVKYKDMRSDVMKIGNSEKFSKVTLDDVLPPSTESVDDYTSTLKDYNFLLKVLQRQKFYKSLPPTIIIGDTIEKYIQAHDDYEYVVHACDLKNIDLNKNCDIDGSTLEKYLEVKDDYDVLRRLSNASKFDIIKECCIGNTIDEYETMLKDYNYIQKCYKKCKDLKTKYAELDARINASESRLKEYKVCPLCGHELGDN